jgi:hypothetical protein
MALTLRILGWILVAVFVAAGLVVSVAFLPLFVGLGVLAGFGALCVRQEKPRIAGSRFGRSPARLAQAVVVGVVAVIYAVIGMASLLGGAFTAATAATVVGLLACRSLRRGAAKDTAHAAGSGPSSKSTGGTDGGTRDADTTDSGARCLLPTDPGAVSIDRLCRAWRVSFVLLQNARTPEALEHVAQLRRRYLDELARRHPEGFRRWIDDGARAAGDPSRYVRPTPLDRGEGEAT